MFSDLVTRLTELDPNARVDILVKPINGQMALAIVREPWDDNILIYETEN